MAGDQRDDECWWSSADDLKTVNLIRRTDDLTTWRSGYDNDYWVPNGLGDEGYTGTAFDSVVWRIGDVQYELNVVYSTSGDPGQVATDLAEQVVARPLTATGLRRVSPGGSGARPPPATRSRAPRRRARGRAARGWPR